jgi:hypothetical protein
MIQFGIYGGPKTDGTQRIYVDDFRVTDYQSSKPPSSSIAAPTNLQIFIK